MIIKYDKVYKKPSTQQFFTPPQYLLSDRFQFPLLMLSFTISTTTFNYLHKRKWNQFQEAAKNLPVAK